MILNKVLVLWLLVVVVAVRVSIYLYKHVISVVFLYFFVWTSVTASEPGKLFESLLVSVIILFICNLFA
jgi:hypothetical protein